MYRPRQPDWKYTMWKFQDFSAAQILREINFVHFEAQQFKKLNIQVNDEGRRPEE